MLVTHSLTLMEWESMVKKVLSSEPLPLSKVKEVIKKRLEEEEGLDIQRTTLSYLERFAKCDSELVDEIIKELKEKFALSNELCVMLVNVLPQTPEEVRTILASEEVTLTSEEIEEIIKIVSKCIKE